MAFENLENANLNEVLAHEFNNEKTVILVFSSEYCDACMALGFELEEIDDEHEHVTIIEIDCAQNEELVEQYNVFQVPTMIIYENENSILWHKEGVMLAPDIEKIINF